MMGTKRDVRNGAAGCINLFEEALVNVVQVFLSKQTATNTRLIGGDTDNDPSLREFGNRVNTAIDRIPLIGIFDVVRRVVIYHAVSVQYHQLNVVGFSYHWSAAKSATTRYSDLR